MSDYPEDIFTEGEDLSVDTLANLGPLAPLAGIWEGTKGVDVNPYIDAPRRQVYVERIEMQPIDRQSNGPQVFFGLRYHVHITKPDEVETYHDQVGYWLWEPATGTIIHTLTIPRGQTVQAMGHAAPEDRTFQVKAERGSTVNGISSGPFLEYGFRTESFTMTVTVNDDGTWSYSEDTILTVYGRPEPFHHTDQNVLSKVGEPTPNPLALEAAGQTG